MYLSNRWHKLTPTNLRLLCSVLLCLVIIVGSYIVYTDLIIHTKLSLVVMYIVTAQTGSML